MSFKRHLALIMVFALLCAAIPSAFAEDDLAVEAEEMPAETVNAMDTLLVDEVDSPQGDEVLAREAGLTEDSEDDETSVPNVEAAVANDPSDFQISNGCLQKYVGFDKDVVIPDGVTRIGADAFFYNKIVESVSIPNTVKWIGNYAFCGCESLKSIYIPDSVTSIGQGGFSSCISLKKARLSRNLNDHGYEGDWEEGWGTQLFDGCRSLEKVEIPNGIKRIGSYAFCYCESLKTVKIPASVTSIGEVAFSGCINLDNIVIPEGVTQIVFCTFQGCQNLNSVHVPASVTYIEKNAFDYCDNLVFRGAAGTYAERFANGMGIPFNAPIVSFENTAQGTMVRINQTLTFKAIQRPSDLAGALVWSSSKPGVATVDQKGRVKGISEGETIITAAPANGLGRAGTLRVVVPESTKITFISEPEPVPLNTVVGIYARAVNMAYDSNLPVKWTSSKTSVLSIESTANDGVYDIVYVKGIKEGKSTLTAKTEDGGKASITVTVCRPDPDNIRIDQDDPLVLAPKEKSTLTATVYPDYAKQEVKWGSANKKVAKVSQKGVVTAVKKGNTQIWVETVNGIRAYIDVIVTREDPYSITLDVNRLTLGIKEKHTLKASVLPSKSKAPLKWTSSNPKVATVDKKGVVKALKKGKTVIEVRAENDVTAEVIVTVKAAPKKVTLNKSGTVTLKLGKTLKLKAKLPSGTASALTWKSSKPMVATVDQNGRVTPLKKGTATITVKTFNDHEASVEVKVK